ncbi:MAG: hypothetical protein EOP05_06195 [Proteobacteria bacterium]|nr:MAG: hypothetical protein EOP05_06195 [Pseudomonadota bacterium]
MKFVKAAVLAVAAVGFVGCSHSAKKEEVAAQPPTAQEQAKSQLASDRDAYVAATQARLESMQKMAGDLRTRAAATQKPQSKKLENAADDMESFNKDIERQLADVKQAAPENWVDERRDVEKVLSRAESFYSQSVTLLK